MTVSNRQTTNARTWRLSFQAVKQLMCQTTAVSRMQTAKFIDISRLKHANNQCSRPRGYKTGVQSQTQNKAQ